MTAHSPVTAPVDPVETFFSWEDDATKDQRRRLIVIRNLSSVRAMRAEGSCRKLYWFINDIAGHWCFKSASAGVLKDVADNLTRLGLAANGLWRIESATDDS